jgi:hypothetical protein
MARIDEDATEKIVEVKTINIYSIQGCKYKYSKVISYMDTCRNIHAHDHIKKKDNKSYSSTPRLGC